MQAAVMIWLILSNLISGVCSVCTSLLHNPAGQTNLNLSLQPFEGLQTLTIEGILNVENAPSSGVPDKENLKFLGDGDPADVPLLEIETQFHRSQQCMFMSGTVLEDSFKISLPSTSDRQYMCGFDSFGNMKISRDESFKLQISRRSPEGYDIYLSGFDSFFFNYGSADNWKKFNDKRIDRVTKIVTECHDNCHLKYTSISACSHTDIELQDELTVEVMHVEIGQTYTLTCSAAGPPYLTSEWRNGGDEIIPGHSETNSTEGGVFKIESSLVISELDVADVGNYTCSISNQIIGNRVKKVISLHYIYVETAPESRYSLSSDESVKLLWTVKGHPLREVRLECISDLEAPVQFDREFQKSPALVNFSREISTEKFDFAVLSCALLDKGDFLEQRIIRFDVKDSEITPEETVEDKGCSCWKCYVILGLLLVVSVTINMVAAIHHVLKRKHHFVNQIKYYKKIMCNYWISMLKSMGYTYNRVPKLSDPTSESDSPETAANSAKKAPLQERPMIYKRNPGEEEDKPLKLHSAPPILSKKER